MIKVPKDPIARLGLGFRVGIRIIVFRLNIWERILFGI